ncbi:MAG: antibiotic biosynthesis monooxygenase [Alphaproteobacteria bacterium]|jgi:heme-degrading monooxygenase HmoA|nr:antibiotic biosynthesis monooxygenase [Alphaproteobacteria bacterium]MBL6672663.1 antibiotic biosynthesis monooxygenase [Alphaproteobacteria bacterium]|tara:strand:+ start:2551 stop:3033 length:483 start_codon:yes stop_codon:yes gene_type:complete
MKTDDQNDDIQAPSKAGWPARYFSVIFTAQRTLSDEDMYSLTSERMVELAQQQPGFLGLESVRGEDGIGITVSYWRDRAAIRAWRIDVEHLAAQQMGRQEFYSWYHIRVAEVVAHRTFDASAAVDSQPDASMFDESMHDPGGDDSGDKESGHKESDGTTS